MPGKVAGEDREIDGLLKPAALSTTNKTEEISERVSGKVGLSTQV